MSLRSSYVIILAIGLLASLARLNAVLTFAALVVALLLVTLLWRLHELPVLLFVAGVQWLQASMKIFHADLLGVAVEDLSEFPGDYVLATVLSLSGVLVFAIGIAIGRGRIQSGNIDLTLEQARRYSSDKLWWAYLASVAACSIILAAAWLFPGLTQPLLVVARIKFAFLAALAFVVCATDHGYRYVIVALIIEMVIGISGFFAEYKTAIYVLSLVFLSARRTSPTVRLSALAGLVILGITTSVVWTAVKGEYRDYVSEGTGQQAVTRSWTDRMDKLVDEVDNLNLQNLAEATDTLATRIAYVDYFAATLINVPNYEPHTDGTFLLDSLVHLVTPRLLFPDKVSLSDNEVVLTYAGIPISESGTGTSIGLGYLGELYVDFGPIGMFIPVLGLGYIVGWIFQYVMREHRIPRFANYGLIIVVLLPASQLEISLIKMLGSIVTSFLVVVVLQRHFGDYFASRFRRLESVAQ